MEEKRNEINEIIKKAIIASIDFEKIMDRIDFNSYLPEDQKKKAEEQPPGYEIYIKMVEKEALKSYIELIQKEIPQNIKKINFVPDPKKYKDKEKYNNKDKEMVYYFVYHLFEAKKTRLTGRKQDKREKEERDYIAGAHRLHKAFDHIPENSFQYKAKSLLKDYNWVKVLYYNELAICYSGLAKSSMSLGYAEESIFLLEELYPELKNIENPAEKRGESVIKKLENRCKVKETPLTPSEIIKLYTFALYNKAEAERLLKEIDSALRTFRRIVKIYIKNENSASHSDFNSALLREALMLIDQGRGQEAISRFNKSEKFQERDVSDFPDYRTQYRDLERASALIDQKEYNRAWELLKVFINNKDWNNTFAQRQAKARLLHLMNEFRENRPEDFQATRKLMKFSDLGKLEKLAGIDYNEETKNITVNLLFKLDDKITIVDAMDEEDKDSIEVLWKRLHSDNGTSKEIKNEYPNFVKTAIGLLRQASERKDGDSFKEACTKLAKFYQDRTKKSEKALKYFFLYLLENKLFSNKFCIDNWLVEDKLDVLLKKYPTDFFIKEIDHVREDEKYLRDFFDEYTKEDITNPNEKPTFSMQKGIVKKIKERLVDIYYQKDKDIELEQIEIKYEHFIIEGTKKSKDEKIKRKPILFIENYFFKNKKGGMQIESISNQMNKNTAEFINNIVGKSKISVESNGEIQGTLSVLRRWNSFTPTLSSSINQSKGGGYFLRFSDNNKSFGIVIDPGYDFLKNFFSQGFKIGDIDLVLVSHAHPDHTDNIASILSLFHEMNGRLGEYPHKKKVNKKNPTLVLSSGVFEQYSRIITSSEKELKDIIVVDGKDIKPEDPVYEDESGTYKIHAFGTTHKDLSQFQSLGFIITANKNDKRKAVIGYTGDIIWRLNKVGLPEYLKYFMECDIICAHLGSIINILKNEDFCKTFCKDYVKYDLNDRCKKYENCLKFGFESVNVTKKKLLEQTHKENHLYLAGLTMFFDKVLKGNSNLKMAIISEFGEELKQGIRIDLYKKFDNWFKERSKEKPKCLPGDIGLEVDVFTGKVLCHCCKRFVDRAEIEPVPYGKEEAIFFVCDECKSVLSTYQRGEKLKDYYENGRKLELVELITDRK